MAIISSVLVMPEGGDGNREPYYPRLCTNTNQISMPNTQRNAMCHFPECSGKLPETAWGLPSSVSPLPVPEVLAILLPQQFHSPSSSLKLLGGKMRHIALPSVRTYSCPKLAKTPNLCLFRPSVFEPESNNPKMPLLLASLLLSPILTTNHFLLKIFSTSELVSK